MLILLLIIAAFSCKDNTFIGNNDLDFSVGKISFRFDNAPQEITKIVARLSREGFNDLVLSLIINDSTNSASGLIENVAVGFWHLRVDAFDSLDIKRFTGETGVEILPSETVHAYLELLPTTGSVDIHVTWATNYINQGLVLYMPFDRSIVDSSGKGNHGIATNQRYTADPLGNPNSAYLFNGDSNYITIPNHQTLNPNKQITITMWLRVDSIQDNYMDILVKGGPVYGYFANRQYGIYTKQNINHWYPEWKSAGDGMGQHECDSHNHSYTVGSWNFFAFVVDRINKKMQIYANGVLTTEVYDSYSSFNINRNPLMIGASGENLYQHAPFRGAMDNLRIYNRALTRSQINQMYNLRK